MRQGTGRGGCWTILLVLLAAGGFGYLVWANAERTPPLVAVVPTENQPTEIGQSWQELLRGGLNINGSPVPTIAIPDQPYVAPTLAGADDLTPTLLQAIDVGESGLRQPVFISGSTPTPLPPTPTIPPTSAQIVTIIPPTNIPRPTSPPSLDVPLIRDPRDHYVLRRPIDPDRTNSGLSYYEYGTNGTRENPYRVHSGVDMANDLGTPVRAAQDGLVIWVTDPNNPERTVFQNSPSYGNVVVIEHDIGHNRMPIYTLYAHLEGAVVKEGTRVKMGDAIALLGNTGVSTGSHVHFEVRVGANTYGSTYNPVLWMAPYVGHGTIAGRIVDSRGNFLQDVEVTLARSGFNRHTTTSYVFREQGSQVNPDAIWNENFIFADVPAGRWEVFAVIDGRRVSKIVEVVEGVTTPVVLEPQQTTVVDQPTPAP